MSLEAPAEKGDVSEEEGDVMLLRWLWHSQV
jgi:hypothetical protein